MKAIVWKNTKPAPYLETISALATKRFKHLGNFDIIAVRPVSAYVTESTPDTPVSSYEIFEFRIIIKGLKDANSSFGHSIHTVSLSPENIHSNHFCQTLSSALKLFNAKTTGSFR